MRLSVAAVHVCLPTAAHAAQAVVPQAIRCRGEEPFQALDTTIQAGRFMTREGAAARQGRLDVLDWLSPGHHTVSELGVRSGR